jgi:hypothetical protein
MKYMNSRTVHWTCFEMTSLLWTSFEKQGKSKADLSVFNLIITHTGDAFF